MSQPPQQPEPQAPERPQLPEDFGYGRHLVDQGPQGPTKESTLAKLKPPGTISMVISGIYAAILVAALGGFVWGFIGKANQLEMTRTQSSSSSTPGKGAKAKKLAQQLKLEKEEREAQYQYDRQLLFTGLGIGLVSMCIGLTTQTAGIVAGLNMVNLNKYSWAFWGLLVSGIPFCSICFLVMYVSEFIVGSETLMMIYMIVFAIFDVVRLVLMIWGLMVVLSGSRRFFEVK